MRDGKKEEENYNLPFSTIDLLCYSWWIKTKLIEKMFYMAKKLKKFYLRTMFVNDFNDDSNTQTTCKFRITNYIPTSDQQRLHCLT